MSQSKSRLVDDMSSVESVESGLAGSYKETMRDYFPDLSGGDAFQSLSKSDYAKVIFCDLYYNTDSTVGCRFQITDNVHEDPCDYIGLFKVGYDSLSQCLAAKLLSQTECEDDGKLLRCTFKPTELPNLEHGFYQFLYVTRDLEVCGASMPFEIKNTIPKDFSSDEDIVADKTEDDFLVVRSNVAEKNRRLQMLLDEMNEKCLAHESEMRKIQTKFRIISEEKLKLEQLLKKACEEKMNLIEENQKLSKERDTISGEKQEAVRILKGKSAVMSTIFEDFACKIRGFEELQEKLEADKNLAIAENANLQERLKKLTEELQNKQKLLEEEKERNQEIGNNLRKENSVLTSQLDDARLMIEALEKSKQLSMTDISSLSQIVADLKQKAKDMKCENYALKSKLLDTTASLNKRDENIQDMKSEVTALKLHIIEMEESKPLQSKSSTSCSSLHENQVFKPVDIPIIIEEKCISVQEESVQTAAETNEELQSVKAECEKLRAEVAEKNDAVIKLKEELVKSNAVVDYLTKERDSIQNNGSRTQEALNECVLRLNEASELYKKQYRKIEKLKKKLKKSKDGMTDLSSEASSVGNLPDFSSVMNNPDELAKRCAATVPLNQNSDSDTGEHVVRSPSRLEKQLISFLKKRAALHGTNSPPSVSSQLPSASKNEPSTSKAKEDPELQTMIEKNLEKLSCSKLKEEVEEEDEVLYSIPCPICDQDVGIYLSSTQEMVKHLEMQHKQQLCPICGRLFDMTLPSKYFQFHVEDHFKTGK